MLKGVNWVAVIVAAVLLQALGYLWYGVLFQDAWLAALGTEPDMTDANLKMGLSVVNTLIVAIGLAWLIGRLGAASLGAALAAAFAAWLFFNFTTMAIDYLYQGRSAQLVAINMGYQLAAYLLAGAVIGLIRPRPASAQAAAA